MHFVTNVKIQQWYYVSQKYPSLMPRLDLLFPVAGGLLGFILFISREACWFKTLITFILSRNSFQQMTWYLEVLKCVFAAVMGHITYVMIARTWRDDIIVIYTLLVGLWSLNLSLNDMLHCISTEISSNLLTNDTRAH